MSMQIPPHPYQVPAAPPPPGVIPNLINPPTNADLATVTLSLFIILAGMFVGLRLYVRFSKASPAKPGWDDYFIILALPVQIAYTTVTIWMCRTGIVARHIWDTPLGVVLYKLPHWAIVLAVLPEPALLFVKLSILSLYYRLFSPDKYVRWGAILGMVVITCGYTSWFFVFIFNNVFDSKVASHLSWAQAAFGVVSDVYIITLPIIAISKLNLKLRTKLGIIAIFLTGLASIGLSILTLFYRVKYAGSGADPTWDSTRRIVVPVLEIDIGIMCACMPLFAHFSPKLAFFERWLTSLRSMGSGLLRSKGSTHPSGGSSSRWNASQPKQVDTGVYVELPERKVSAGDVSTTSITKLKSNQV